MTEMETQDLDGSEMSLERMRLLLDVSTAVSRSLDPQEVAEVALKLACEAVGLEAGMVMLLQRGQRIVLAGQGFPADWLYRFQTAAPDIKSTIVQATIQDNQPKVFSDLRLAPDDNMIQWLRQAQLVSLACLPLQVPGSVAGAMLIGSAFQRQLQPADVDFLEAIAGQISSGLRNAWLFAQSQRRLDELESITMTAHAVISSRDSDEILAYIMEELITGLNIEAAALLLLDPAGQELEFAAVAGPESGALKGIRLPLEQGIVGWVARHNQPLLVPDVSRDERFFKGLDRKTATVTRSVLCVPLRARNQLIGVVEVINKRRGQFTKADQRLLELLATFAAVAIENARFYREANSQIEQATLYAHDLTATFKQERKQRKSLDQLRYSFLNVVSHELKTPLTVILQGLEALKNPRRGALNAEQVEITDMLGQQSGYLYRLIDGLITFATFSARQGTMKFKRVHFDKVLDAALSLSEFKAARTNVTVKQRRQVPPLTSLLCDEAQMSEAIGHLIDNAIKFSPDGGEVIVQTGIEADELVMDVIDRGRGLPPDQLDRIWDSFTQMNTTMERGLEGLGLGLAITRYIVEAHNGKVSVSSVLGQGSKFTLRLPLDS